MGIVAVWDGVLFTATGHYIHEIVSYYPDWDEIYITSSWRPTDSGSYHQSGNACDFGFNYGSLFWPDRAHKLAVWLNQWSRRTLELIHTCPLGGIYVKNRVHVAPYDAAAHQNHVHWALTEFEALSILQELRSTNPPPQPPIPEEEGIWLI